MAQPIWITPAGSLGLFPANVSASYQLLAEPVLPSTSITFKVISGFLPTGITLSTTGLLSGTPALVTDLTSTFTVRVTDNRGNLRDRTFSIEVTGIVAPKLVTQSGLLLSVLDSTWVEFTLDYSNPIDTNEVVFEINQGLLPPGIELNEGGVLRGYAHPPEDNVTAPEIVTVATATTSGTNIITCISTLNFIPGRPIVFTGNVFGYIVAGTTYFVKEVISLTECTISLTVDGPTFNLSTDSGNMTVTLAPVSVGEPTVRTFNFSVNLISLLGNDSAVYSITVINQNASISIGGPGNPPNTRPPAILNTRPTTFNLNNSDQYYGYYIVPPKNSRTPTVLPSIAANTGTYQSDNYFAFKVIGNDFDDNPLSYSFSALPIGLTGDTTTGWITGTPILESVGITEFNFTAYAYKTGNPTITTDNFNFKMYLSNQIVGDVTWITDSDLGIIYNSTVSSLKVVAESDVPLSYSISSGSLPDNLTLLSNGEISGIVAYQPGSGPVDQGTVTSYTFTVTAYSPSYPSIVTSNKTFTISVEQYFDQPTDTLYIKAAPSVEDRNILESLLTNTSIIPDDYLYRPEDSNFGKATSVIYEHAYGIYSSNLEEYIAAITRNHYWRNITLGEIKTAVAKNENGEILYEVVYSEVIDDLINPQGESVPEEIVWPRDIDLFLGPWYTSITDTFTSYEDVLNQEYYTSLTSGTARLLYPNSLYNMRTRVAQELGQIKNKFMLPLWMTSQQSSGGTLGYTQAWVICYTKFGYTTDSNGNQVTYATKIKDNINNNWPYKLNQINFKLDRFSVDPIESSDDFSVLFPRQTILPNESQ